MYFCIIIIIICVCIVCVLVVVYVLGICEHLYAHASRCVQLGQRGQRHFFAGDPLLFRQRPFLSQAAGSNEQM